eukprot:139096-Amphidinium_carterae.1
MMVFDYYFILSSSTPVLGMGADFRALRCRTGSSQSSHYTWNDGVLSRLEHAYRHDTCDIAVTTPGHQV